MEYYLSKAFRKKYKTQNVRIQKAIDKALLIFSENPHDSSLDNHTLEREWQGFRSININDVKNDYRAIYEEVKENEDFFAYFVIFGTHNELF